MSGNKSFKKPVFSGFFFFSSMIGKVSHAINREKQKLLPFRNDIAIIRVMEYNIYNISKHILNRRFVMEFMSAREAADKWGISQRRVAVLCSENRIDNATMVGNMWIIPTTAEKPIDARSVRYRKCDSKKTKPF